MNKREETEEIYCHKCGRWIRARTETIVINWEQVECLHCGVNLGFAWDWPEMFGDDSISG